MTHDELLAKISPTDWRDGIPQRDAALRAVVELHKPEWVLPMFILEGRKPELIAICTHCSDKPQRTPYPCSTIQAIEKELQ